MWVIIDKTTNKVHGTSYGSDKPVKNPERFDVLWMTVEPRVGEKILTEDKRIGVSPQDEIAALKSMAKMIWNATTSKTTAEEIDLMVKTGLITKDAGDTMKAEAELK